MRFFEPNEKRNTVAVYVFFVALFCVLCTIVGINIKSLYSVALFIFEVIKPLIYGVVIAFLMHPLVRFTETRILGNKKEKKIGFRHFISVVAVYIVVIALIFLFAVTVIPQIISNYDMFKDRLTEFAQDFENKTTEFISSSSAGESVYIYHDGLPDLRKDPSDGLLHVTLRNFDGIRLSAKFGSARQEVKEVFDAILSSVTEMITNSLPGVFTSAMTIITETKNLIIGIILSLYFLLGERNLLNRLHRIVKAWLSPKSYKRFMWVVVKSKNIFRDYIVVRLLDGFIVGALLFICLYIFGTPFSVLLSVIMGVASLFPFIGPIVGTGAGAFILLLVDFKYALLFLIVAVVLNLLDSRYVEPILNAGRNQYKLAAIWIFAAIVVMCGLFGVVGILIGIPFVACVYAVIKELCDKKLRAVGESDKTCDYFAKHELENSENMPNVKEGTDVTTFFSEKKDDTQAYNEIKDRFTKSSDSAKKAFRRIKNIFKRKK